MTDQPVDDEKSKPTADKPVGKGVGGADTSGSGNILAEELEKGGDAADGESRDH